MNNLLSTLKHYRNGLLLLIIGIAALLIVHGNPWREYQLINGGTIVEGVVIDVNDFEDREDNGNLTRYFLLKYEFTTKEGTKLSDVVEIPGNSEQKGFRTGQSVEIRYMTSDPNIHRITALTTTNTTQWLIKTILLSILAIAPGCYLLVRAYRQEHTSN